MTDPADKPPKRSPKWIAAASALVVAATPGVYSAWQGAKQAWTQRQEQRLRDAQETDLQKAVRAHTEAIRAIKEAMVTHRDLVDLVVKLQATRPAPAPRPPRAAGERPLRPTAAARPSPPRNTAPDAPTAALRGELDRLRAEARAGDKARDKATQALKGLPKLKGAAEARSMIQQQAAP